MYWLRRSISRRSGARGCAHLLRLQTFANRPGGVRRYPRICLIRLNYDECPPNSYAWCGTPFPLLWIIRRGKVLRTRFVSVDISPPTRIFSFLEVAYAACPKIHKGDRLQHPPLIRFPSPGLSSPLRAPTVEASFACSASAPFLPSYTLLAVKS